MIERLTSIFRHVCEQVTEIVRTRILGLSSNAFMMKSIAHCSVAGTGKAAHISHSKA